MSINVNIHDIIYSRVLKEKDKNITDNKLDEFEARLRSSMYSLTTSNFINKLSNTIKHINGEKPILEIGSGVGYLSWLLSLNNIKVIATDISQRKIFSNEEDIDVDKLLNNLLNFDFNNVNNINLELLVILMNTIKFIELQNTTVETLNSVDAVIKYNNVNVLLCSWPPCMTQMLYEALQYYYGNYLIYIGRLDGSCECGKLFNELETKWELYSIVEIPTAFIKNNDVCHIYKRK